MEKGVKEELSTPHGALGTLQFYSIRDILEKLSTPHGALGTSEYGFKGSVH